MTTTVSISYGFKSDVGRVRDTNEDSCAVLNRAQLNGKLDGLLIVADGLGGRRAGEVASSLLVETVSVGVLEVTSTRTRPFESVDIEQLMGDTIVRANGKIMTLGRFHRREETRGMATTCVVTMIHDGRMTVGNVGDSRVYLLRDGLLTQLTKDHSDVFEEMVKGNITEDEARNHRFRNQITRAVGLDPNVQPDIDTLTLQIGDTVLLCSDGLTTEVPDKLIGATLNHADGAQSASEALVALALKRGGRDNVTTVVMRYGDFTPAPDIDILTDPDEDFTDPDPDWRSTSGDFEDNWEYRPSTHRSPANIDPIEPTDIARLPLVRPGSATARIIQFAPPVIALLVLAILVQSAIIYNLNHKAPVQFVNSRRETPNEPRASPGSLTYEQAKTVIDMPVLSDYLQLSVQGSPIVARQTGEVVTVLPTRNLLSLGPGFPTIPTPPASKQGQGHGTHVVKAHADLFCDNSGNYYYLNPTTKCIETYTKDGTRTNQDLGKGQFTAPTKLIVGTSGDIYVIDDGRLKVLSVKDKSVSPTHPKNADY